MLGPWRTHAQFQDWLQQRLRKLLPQREAQIKFHADALEKVYNLDLDRLKKLILSRYSYTGRPAVNQPEIFRALVLAKHYKESITSFVKLKSGRCAGHCLRVLARRYPRHKQLLRSFQPALAGAIAGQGPARAIQEKQEKA